MWLVFGVTVALAYFSIGLKMGLLFGLIALVTLYIGKIVLTLPLVGLLSQEVRLANMERIEFLEDVLVGVVFTGCSYLYRPSLGLAAAGASVVSLWVNETLRRDLRTRGLGTTGNKDPAIGVGEETARAELERPRDERRG